MIETVIAAVEEHGYWRGTLNRAAMALLRLRGYTVRVLGGADDAWDVEVT